MDLVLDANIIIAALIKDSTTRKLILNSKVNFYIPEIIIEEINKNIKTLERKTKLSGDELKLLLLRFIIISNIKTIKSNEIINYIERAEEISPD